MAAKTQNARILRLLLVSSFAMVVCGLRYQKPTKAPKPYDADAFKPPEEDEDFERPSSSTHAPTEPPHVFCPINTMHTYPCTCEKGGTEGLTVHCENANLAMMALGLGNIKDKLIHTLRMTKNYVRRLKGGIFHNITIANLEVSYNKIEAIEDDVFDTLGDSLVSLNLEGNNLKTVPSSAINKLSRLHYLNLAFNEISVIPANAFSGVPNVKELRLDNNHIDKIFSGAFNNMLRSLEKLHIHHNKLKKFERNVFKQMKLKYLDLSHNEFIKFDKRDFTDLTFLWFLNVSDNHLNDIPRSALNRNAQLRVINGSNNNFREIDAYLLKGLRLLRDLYLSGNKIKKIAQKAFMAPTRLRTLDLSRNAMEDTSYEMFKDMNWLEKLDLSYNKISRIASSSFQRMYQVVVDLSHNNISFIGKGAFLEMANVTVFDLSYNSISEILPDTFQTSDVNVLLLHHNNITDLSKVLITNLTGIKIFNISHNRIESVNRHSFSKKKLYELHTIDLSYNNITEVGGNAFEKFGSIRNIIMHHNSIRKIGYGSFGAMSTLLEMDISYNNITEITSGGFSNLVSIRTIHAHHNKIKSMFVIPMALNEVYIQHNDIKRIPPGIFPAMNSLLNLHLDNNNITSLERGSFKGLLTLRTLSLGFNNISRIPWEALEAMSSLQYLYLHGNNITMLNRKAFGNLPVVFDLRLDYNNIQNVSVGSFEGMLQLIKLNMSHNNISRIPPSAFSGLVSLRNLDISYNLVSSLENKTHGILEDLLSLNVFNASHNHLSFISDRSFPKSPYIPYRITHIDMSHNYIPILTSTFDDGMKQVQFLKLQNNILNEIRPGVLSNLTYLRHLDLSGNELQKLPVGTFGVLDDMEELVLGKNRLGSIDTKEILSMKKLQLLDLRDNRFTSFYEELIPIMKENFTVLFSGNLLTCDCVLRPLRSWLSNQHSTSQWDDVRCHLPPPVADKQLSSMSIDDLTCRGVSFAPEDPVIKPDIQIRGSEVQKDHGLRVVWYVATREDVAGFKATLRNLTGTVVSEQTVPYDKREYVFRDLEPSEVYQLCFRAVDSRGTERLEFDSQCAEVGPVGQGQRPVGSPFWVALTVLVVMTAYSVILLRF